MDSYIVLVEVGGSEEQLTGSCPEHALVAAGRSWQPGSAVKASLLDATGAIDLEVELDPAVEPRELAQLDEEEAGFAGDLMRALLAAELAGDVAEALGDRVGELAARRALAHRWAVARVTRPDGAAEVLVPIPGADEPQDQRSGWLLGRQLASWGAAQITYRARSGALTVRTISNIEASYDRVYAYCHTRQDDREFVLDRIVTAEFANISEAAAA